MENASVGAAPQEILYDLNSVNLPDVDNAIFRDNDESANFLPDIIQPYLPPYPNPSRNPSVFQNSTNSTFEYLFYFTPTLNNIFILACLAICTIWCIVMNLLIIGALWKGHERDKEHVTDMYLINLAFADVLLGFLVFPFMSIVILVGYFPLSATWCNIWVYFDYYLIIATSYGFAALMCSFLVMLKWPEYYPKSKKLHLVFLLLVWILSNAPWTAPFFHDRVSFIYPTGVCGFSIQKNRYFTFYIGFTGLYIPLAIALVAGIFAVKYLKQSARAPFLKLLLKNDSCHVHPFVPSSASDSEFNGLQNIRRGNGVSRTQYMRPMPAGLSPSALPNESSDSSGSSNRPLPNQTKRRSVINISTFHRNKALQDSVRKHFPLVATSLILFVLCRSFFYVYFGVSLANIRDRISRLEDVPLVI
ncbi:unnamed protein product [Orchesella dallaii]|uniref:G-protein coupled receptors family 1 profile domain-containing protein n=1 Tax=Orchesella dallaii TaxID=48710 RepID=A0ABP1QWJ1_9HEXA